MRKAGSIGAGTSPGRVWKGKEWQVEWVMIKLHKKSRVLLKVDADRLWAIICKWFRSWRKQKYYLYIENQIMKVDLFNKEGKKT